MIWWFYDLQKGKKSILSLKAVRGEGLALGPQTRLHKGSGELGLAQHCLVCHSQNTLCLMGEEGAAQGVSRMFPQPVGRCWRNSDPPDQLLPWLLSCLLGQSPGPRLPLLIPTPDHQPSQQLLLRCPESGHLSSALFVTMSCQRVPTSDLGCCGHSPWSVSSPRAGPSVHLLRADLPGAWSRVGARHSGVPFG